MWWEYSLIFPFTTSWIPNFPLREILGKCENFLSFCLHGSQSSRSREFYSERYSETTTGYLAGPHCNVQIILQSTSLSGSPHGIRVLIWGHEISSSRYFWYKEIPNGDGDELDHSTHFKNCLEIYLCLTPLGGGPGLDFFFLLCMVP